MSLCVHVSKMDDVIKKLIYNFVALDVTFSP